MVRGMYWLLFIVVEEVNGGEGGGGAGGRSLNWIKIRPPVTVRVRGRYISILRDADQCFAG